MTRVLDRIYAERDVADVESYVRLTLERIAPELESAETERLAARGILLVRRMASALPPGASLAAVLEERLQDALGAYLWRDVRDARVGGGFSPRRAA